MKKRYLAVAVVVALGVAWAGTAWFSGKEMEKRILSLNNQQDSNNPIELSFKLLDENGIKAEITDYKRGFFSSDAKLILKPKKDETNNAKQHITFDLNVEHGLIPVSRLLSLKLMPKLATVHFTPEKSDLIAPFYAYTGDKAPFTGTTDVGFDGDTHSVISVPDLNIPYDGNLFTSKATDIALSLNKDYSDINLKTEISNLSLVVKDDYSPLNMSVNNLSLDYQFNELMYGYANNTIKSLEINGNKIQNLVYNTSIKKDSSGKNVDYTINASTDDLNVAGKSFGSGDLKLVMNNIDAKAYKTYYDIGLDSYKAMYKELVVQNRASNSEPVNTEELYKLMQETEQKQMQAMMQILEGKPNILLSPVNWKTAKGNAKFDLKLALQPVQNPGPESTPLPQELSVINNLTVDLDASVPMLLDLTSKITGSPENSEEMNKMVNAQLTEVANQTKYFTLDKDKLTSKLTYKYGDQALELNGNKIPLAQLVMLILGSGMMPAEPYEDEEDMEPETEEAQPVSPPEAAAPKVSAQ